MRKRIVVVGSINLDLVAVTPRIPGPGETIAGLSFQTFSGGKGANQAVAAARLGASVSMIGKIGTDTFGSFLKSELETYGVDVTGVSTAVGSSGVALINTDANGENAITVVAGANGTLSPVDLEAGLNLIRSASVLLTQLEIPLETVEYLSKIAKREDIPLILDPAPARALPASLLKDVDWLTPNESEACSLLGQTRPISEDELESIAHSLIHLGCSNVILKVGKRGSFLALSDGTRTSISAFKVSAIDTTAAGDAYNGAFAVGLVGGKSTVESARYASAVAAISVTRAGAQPAMPTSEKVEEFLQEIALASPARN